MCSGHLLKRHYFPFLQSKILFQLYVFSLPEYRTTFNIHHLGEFQIWKFGNFAWLHQPTKVLLPPLISWTVQDFDTWNSFSPIFQCEFILFDQGFKHYTVPTPEEVPLQCFATLLSIPFTSENSSLAHLLITFLFAAGASHYSSPWLGDEPVHTSLSPPVPVLGVQAPSS